MRLFKTKIVKRTLKKNKNMKKIYQLSPVPLLRKIKEDHHIKTTVAEIRTKNIKDVRIELNITRV